MKSLNVIKYSRVWFTLSGTSIVLSILAIIIFGLNWGMDFTGGSLLNINFGQDVQAQDITRVLSDAGYVAVTQLSDTGTLIRTQPISIKQHEEMIAVLKDKFGNLEELQFDSVGPAIGQELKEKSIIAVILLLILIAIYVWFAFRKVSKPVASWKYGVLTIISALHDIIIPLGVFAVLGHYIGYEVNAAFIAAILTILGYSINDTIVVFDRTRENLVSERHSSVSFAEIVNKSVSQTLARSINTTLTTLIALIAIYFLGGETTQPFALALIIGIATGAYSSIFIASPLLVVWEKYRK